LVALCPARPGKIRKEKLSLHGFIEGLVGRACDRVRKKAARSAGRGHSISRLLGQPFDLFELGRAKADRERRLDPAGRQPLSLRDLLQSIQIPSIYLPCGWREAAMADKILRLRDRPNESEKITINVGFVDLGHIDLLVREGFYSNRTDFIRTAIRNQLAAHADAVKQSIVRHTLELGLRRYSREELEAVRAAGSKLHIQVVGLATIADDVTPELARATIESVTVLGALHASQSVKAALSDRIG
jgi:Arc/MetJ-type ribon-helix-helix transcriptional regulator